jgi:GntR family transcriptional regulator/MocR family aminotransferase
MRDRHAGALLDTVIPGQGAGMLYQQVYRRIRDSILAGRLRAGDRLPSTRTYAADAGISRKTAEEAYAQLEAEGYLHRRAGSGSFVAEAPAFRPGHGKSGKPAGRRALSRRGRAIGSARACIEPMTVRAFAGGLPAVDAFPVELWQRLLARRARRLDGGTLCYGDPAGYLPLRESLASYLGTSRGVRCDASQIVIVSSSQQALDLAARLLLDPGDPVWVEDPGYPGAKAALRGAGADLIPVPVDDHGLDVDRGMAMMPDARVACVTPSHQYPLGVTMSLERRMSLLAWARTRGAWIVEDDYDSEFRYESRPLAAIQGLDTAGRVIYVGTFTKVLYPSLRLAYIVLPPDLVTPFVNARTQMDGHVSTFMQGVVADFIDEGHFAAHVRRMRTLYRARRDVFMDVAQRQLGSAIDFPNADAGLRATGIFRSGRNDRDVSRRALKLGVEAPPLSSYYDGRRPRTGLLLGYAALSPDAIRAGVRALARAF